MFERVPRWVWAVGLFVGVLLWAGVVYVQGFELGEEGFWLHAATVGGDLHDTLELGGASGRVHLLRGVGALFGLSARTLAWLQAFLTALVGLWGSWFCWRRGLGYSSAVFALAAIALGPVPPWLVPVVAVVAARESAHSRWALCAWALSAAFGLGAFFLASLLLFFPSEVSAACPPRARERIVGLVCAGVVLSLSGILAGDLGREWQHGWSGALSNAWMQLREGSAWSWWQSFAHGPYLSTPFAELGTGEALGARWPAHPALRQSAHRLLYLALLGGACLYLWKSSRRRWLYPLSLCGALILSVRGDLPQLRPALFLAIPGWFLLTESRRARRWIATALLLVLLPLLGEKLWLLTHYYRDSLLLLDQPRANILLDRTRTAELDRLSTALREAGPPMLVWPDAAGLHVLTGIEAASRFVRQPREDVSKEMIQEFTARPPLRVLLAPPAIRGPNAVAWRQPELHEWMRLHYQLLGSYMGGIDRFRVLAPLPVDTKLDDLPLPSRLPFAEMGVATEPGPTLQAELAVGQSFRVGSTDFAGISLRWQTDRPNLSIPLRFHLWSRDAGEQSYDTLLNFWDADIDLPQSGHRSYLRIGPVPDTAGADLALTFELREPIMAQVQPLWHRHDTGTERVDFYPEGTAMLNDEPVAADFYFFAY